MSRRVKVNGRDKSPVKCIDRPHCRSLPFPGRPAVPVRHSNGLAQCGLGVLLPRFSRRTLTRVRSGLHAVGVVAAVSLTAACANPRPPPQPPGLQPAEPPVPTPQAIVARLLRTYRQARTYRDTGESVVRRRDVDGTHVSRARFATTYVRDTAMRFEFQPIMGYEGSRPTIIASRGEVTLATAPRGGWNVEKPVGDALSAFAGVTSGASWAIGSLLFGRDALSRCTVRGDDVLVDGDECFQIRCGSDTELEVFMVRKRDSTLRAIRSWEDYAGVERYEGDLADYARNPRPLPGAVSREQILTFRAEINGSVGGIEVDLTEEQLSRLGAVP